MKDSKQIANHIINKQDLIYLLDDINQAQDAVYKEGRTKLSEKTKGMVSEELRRFFKNQEQKNNLQTREKQEEFLDEFKEYLQELPQVKLTLAFSPSDNFLEEISEWLEDQIGEKVIIDLTIDHKIVGGAIIEYNGHYLNLALKKKIKKLTHE